jgi:hypothetical protein
MCFALAAILSLTALACEAEPPPEPSRSAAPVAPIASAVPNRIVTCIGVPESKCFEVVDDMAGHRGVTFVRARVKCSVKSCTLGFGSVDIQSFDAAGRQYDDRASWSTDVSG